MMSRYTKARGETERPMSMIDRAAPDREPTARTNERSIHALSGTAGLESNVGSSAKKTRARVIHFESGAVVIKPIRPHCLSPKQQSYAQPADSCSAKTANRKRHPSPLPRSYSSQRVIVVATGSRNMKLKIKHSRLL